MTYQVMFYSSVISFKLNAFLHLVTCYRDNVLHFFSNPRLSCFAQLHQMCINPWLKIVSQKHWESCLSNICKKLQRTPVLGNYKAFKKKALYVCNLFLKICEGTRSPGAEWVKPREGINRQSSNGICWESEK